MKKLSKILASVLTVAMAMSTVVMPITAEAADYGKKYVWKTFADASDITDMVGGASKNTIVDGLAGKHASDKVAKILEHTGWKGGTWTDNIITAEVQAYVPDGKIELYSGTAVGGDRPGIYIQNGKFGYVKANGWEYTEICDVDKTKWHKMALEMNKATGMTKIYLDGELINSGTDIFTYGTEHSQDWRVQSNGYIDNWHIYAGEYDPNNDIMPAEGGDHTFFSGTMTVAEVKAELMAEQDATKAVAQVYTDAVGGTEAADTDTIKAGWYAVVTSKSGSLYNADDVYQVVDAVSVGSVEYVGTTVTGTVTNLTDTPVPSMTMILVMDGGKLVYSSETQTNIGQGTATFTIEGVDSLSNAEVFFVKDWTDPYAVLDELYDVD